MRCRGWCSTGRAGRHSVRQRRTLCDQRDAGARVVLRGPVTGEADGVLARGQLGTSPCGVIRWMTFPRSSCQRQSAGPSYSMNWPLSSVTGNVMRWPSITTVGLCSFDLHDGQRLDRADEAAHLLVRRQVVVVDVEAPDTIAENGRTAHFARPAVRPDVVLMALGIALAQAAARSNASR